MRHFGSVSRVAMAVSAVAAFMGATGAVAQAPAAPAPAAAPKVAIPANPHSDLTKLDPASTTYTPKKTPWGDWDFRGTWPIENINQIKILFQRPKVYGNRVWVNDAEFAKRVAFAQKSDGSFSQAGSGVGTPGTQGLSQWVLTTPFGRRTSMLVSPADGQLPPLTPQADALFKAGRSGWVVGQEYDGPADFDSWDRCVSRGFPASMFPFRYNNGIRIFQSPGVVVIHLEMLGERIVHMDDSPRWPGNVEAWMGDSRGHWEGKTLVIETTNIKSGDSVTYDLTKRAAAPLNMATQATPPFNTIPTSAKAKTVERLTMTDANTINYEITYSDPDVYTQPWTARFDWNRDDKYEFFEYACHEGNVQLRNYVTSSRAHRAQRAAGQVPADEKDSRARFAQPFDRDPATAQDGETAPARRSPEG